MNNLSSNSRSERSAAVAACWAGVVGIDSYGEAPLRIGLAQSFFRHEVRLAKDINHPEETFSVFHTIAKVKWYMNHPQGSYIHPLIKICATTFDSETSASFIPVSRIAGRVATTKCKLQFDYGEDTVLVTVPLLKTVLSNTLSIRYLQDRLCNCICAIFLHICVISIISCPIS